MKLQIVEQPDAEPVNWTDARPHMSRDDAESKDMIERMIRAARATVEHEAERSLVTQTLRATWYEGDDVCGPLELPHGPVQSILCVTSNGVTLTEGQYDLRRHGTRDVLHLDRTATPIVVRYVAGYGDPADVPEDIRQLILCLANDMFENRGATVERQRYEVAFGLSAVCNRHRPGGL